MLSAYTLRREWIEGLPSWLSFVNGNKRNAGVSTLHTKNAILSIIILPRQSPSSCESFVHPPIKNWLFYKILWDKTNVRASWGKHWSNQLFRSNMSSPSSSFFYLSNIRVEETKHWSNQLLRTKLSSSFFFLLLLLLLLGVLHLRIQKSSVFFAVKCVTDA